MAQTKIDGLLFREMVMAGAALLEQNKEAVDALNVFPVPDGDTGTNMTLTAHAAVRELNQREYMRIDEAADILAKGALRGARGGWPAQGERAAGGQSAAGRRGDGV